MSRKILIEFSQRHPDSRTALEVWFHILESNQFSGFDALRKIFPSADKVGELYVFNIGGNKYRLIAAIAFAPQLLWVKAILTHTEYDKGDWK